MVDILEFVVDIALKWSIFHQNLSLSLSAVRAAAARGCVLAFAGWWVALATPTQLTLFHYFCLCLGLTAEMRRVDTLFDNNVKAVIRTRPRKVSRGAAEDGRERLCSCSAKAR